MSAPHADYTASRSKRLGAATRDAHERLDQYIRSANPFADRGRYGAFLRMQYALHRDLDVLFFEPRLDALLPDLQGRRRLDLIRKDLRDLGLEEPRPSAAPQFEPAAAVDLTEALGWLYVVEGSNLGAAFLLKEAASLGLTGQSGARHLAAAPEGRGLHWRTFTAALDLVELSEGEEQGVVSGAREAFATAEAYARKELR